MNASSAGAVLGLAVGCGLALVGSWLMARRPLRMVDRIGPYVGLPGAASAVGSDPTVSLGSLAALWGGRSARRPDAPLATMLSRSGRPTSPAQYRLERMTWAGIAGAGGFLLGLLLMSADPSLLPPSLLAAVGAVAGWYACDARLRHQVRERQRVLERQLPLLADLVALAVSAGATPVAALESAAAASGGPMAEETGRAVELIRSGASADAGLRAFADHAGVPSIMRFVESLLVAIELGTPLAEVARAQAADIRADERRRLMESAGRKDVAMLVPIVFLVLPSVVLIAIFPGVQSLRLVVP